MRKKITRRSFLKKAAVTAALGGMSTILLTQKAPANISNNKKPNIRTFDSGILNFSPLPLKSKLLGNPR